MLPASAAPNFQDDFEELRDYLEEFSPCADGQCEIRPQAISHTPPSPHIGFQRPPRGSSFQRQGSRSQSSVSSVAFNPARFGRPPESPLPPIPMNGGMRAPTAIRYESEAESDASGRMGDRAGSDKSSAASNLMRLLQQPGSQPPHPNYTGSDSLYMGPRSFTQYQTSSHNNNTHVMSRQNSLIAASLRSGRESASASDTEEEDMFGKYGGNNLTFTKLERPSLSELLQPHLETEQELAIEFESFQFLSAYLLGSPMSALPLMALWRPAIHAFRFAMSKMNHVPTVDLGFSKISPKLRRSMLVVASMQYRCGYCAALYSGMGDILRGSFRSQVNRNAREKDKLLLDATDPKSTKAESAMLRLVTAAARIPSKVTPELKKDVISAFGIEGLQMAASMVALNGLSNVMTDGLGIELGLNEFQFAQENLSEAGWDGSRHAPSALATQTPREQQAAILAREFKHKRGLRKMIELKDLLRNVQHEAAATEKWFHIVPTTHNAIHEWLRMEIGFVPQYISELQALDAKRAVAGLFWMFLIRPANAAMNSEHRGVNFEWSSGANCLMFFVYTTLTGNLLLRGHAAYLASHFGVPLSVLLDAEYGFSMRNQRLDAALDFIRASATLDRHYTADVNRALLGAVQSPQGVLEMLSTLGVFNALHRLSAMVAPEPTRFEPEVRQFLVLFKDLRMDPDDASPQRMNAREFDQLEFLFQ
ncbi:hypothetical protein BC830DRAFT_1228382 [Chytriomyces sp. MP71]|nr:hypothetical protein BC830DRAFT_1228382 [Chytriomyces sp. MP71]